MQIDLPLMVPPAEGEPKELKIGNATIPASLPRGLHPNEVHVYRKLLAQQQEIEDKLDGFVPIEPGDDPGIAQIPWGKASRDDLRGMLEGKKYHAETARGLQRNEEYRSVREQLERIYTQCERIVHNEEIARHKSILANIESARNRLIREAPEEMHDEMKDLKHRWRFVKSGGTRTNDLNVNYLSSLDTQIKSMKASLAGTMLNQDDRKGMESRLAGVEAELAREKAKLEAIEVEIAEMTQRMIEA